MVEGHADSRGTNEYNLALGERRSIAVRDYMSSLGVAGDRLRTISYGEEVPVAPNDTAEGRQQNRRVELVKRG